MNKIFKTILAFSFIYFFGVSLSSTVLAARPDTNRLPIRVATPSQRAGTQSCQAREAAIKTRLARLIRLAMTMQEKFDAIATRVKDYYMTKIVASGRTVNNYDTLVTDIQTKKDLVATALTKAQTDASNFSCESGDPRTLLTIFNTDMKEVKKALKNYRVSIRNLIVAVRSINGEINPTRPVKPTRMPKVPRPTHSNQGGQQ